MGINYNKICVFDFETDGVNPNKCSATGNGSCLGHSNSDNVNFTRGERP